MDPLLVVSPHLDDAVLSVGQVLGGWPGATVVTVCSHVPADQRPRRTEYDANSGFLNASQATYCRRREDRDAVAVLGAKPHHLGMYDDQYGGSPWESMVDPLAQVVAELNPQVVLAPLGLVHPDHLRVGKACETVARIWPSVDWYVYEDLPSRVLYPEAVPPAVRWWAERGWAPELGFVGTSDLATKEQAVRRYSSQLWALGEGLHNVLVPERVWRLWRND